MRTHFVWRLDELKRWTLNEIKKSLASHTAATLAPSSGTAGMVYFSSEVASETAFGASSAVGTSTKVARADHTHGTPAAPNTPGPASVVSASTAFGQSTAVGSSTKYAREDHVHGTPADPGNITSHVAAADPHTGYQLESEKNAANGYAGLDASSMLLSSFMGAGAYSSLTFLRGDRTWTTVSGGDVPGFGATVTGETAFDLSSNAGVSTSVSRADHTHGTPATPAGGGTPATGVLPSTAFGQSTSVGVSTNYARQDHVHGTPTDPITSHVANADPHTGYTLESREGVANGVATLDATTKVPTAQLGSGVADNTKFLRGDQTWSTVSGGAGSTPPVIRLNYSLAADTTVVCSAGVWTDVVANQNFDVGSTASIMEFSVRCSPLLGTGAGGSGSQLVLDSAGTSALLKLGGEYGISNQWRNPFSGSGPVFVTGLSSATHTVKVQVVSEAVTAATFNCRPVTRGNYEYLYLQVLEHS